MSKDKIEVNMNVYDIPILVETLEKLNKENTILRQNSQYLVKQKDELEEEIERLNNIINKAIEYIRNNYPVCAGKELLEILKGEDK